MTKPANALRLEHGFGIIELLIVIIIATLLMTVAYPNLARLLPAHRLEGAARNLMADLQKVRFRAISENQCFQVTFSAGAGTYQLQKKPASPGCIAGAYATDGVAQAIDSASAVTLSTTANPVFDSRGGAQPVTTVTLSSRTSATRLVKVDLSGRVYVQ